MKRPSINGRTIAAMRTYRGLSQSEVGRRAETTAHHVSRIERGRRNASPALLKRLLAALAEEWGERA